MNAPAGSGVAWMVHRVPSHFSASGTVEPPLSVPVPTAKQVLAVGQDTPSRPLLPPGGIAAACSVQAVPVPPLGERHPGAAVGVEPDRGAGVRGPQDTPLMLLLPGGAGMACAVHLVPFQISASGTAAAVLLLLVPTAMQSFTAGQPGAERRRAPHRRREDGDPSSPGRLLTRLAYRLCAAGARGK